MHVHPVHPPWVRPCGSVKIYLAVGWAPLSPPYTNRVRGKAGRKGWQRSGNTGQLLNDPSSAATPAPPLVSEPIVEVYNIKTHNFYEIKVDF